MTRLSCSACKSPLDAAAGPGARCPTCGSPVLYKPAHDGPEEWDSVARRDAAFAARWELGDPIGQGRSGSVFRAIARDSGDVCAVKLLERVSDPAVVHLFHSGDGCGPVVEHAGVASPIACGVLHNATGQEIGYFVRPFVDGRALTEEMATGPLPLARALTIFAGVLGALQAAHRAGLVHGDPKPADVILTEDGQVRLVDVGCPREPLPVGAIGRPLPAGSPEYLAPEVAEGGAPGPASDLYAAAAMLLEMLLGANPFRQDTPQATLAAHAGPPPIPPEIGEASPEVAELLRGALATEPVARPDVSEALRTSQELARSSAARGLLLRLRLPRRSDRAASSAAGSPWAGRALAAGAVTLMLAAALAVLMRSHVEPAPDAGVRLIAGASALVVRIAEPGRGPIRVRCWADGTPEAAAPLQPSVSPTASGPLTVRIPDLKPDTSYRVRVLHEPGEGGEPIFTAHTRKSTAELVGITHLRYQAGGQVRLVVALRDPELALQVLVSGQASARTTGGPAARDGVPIALPALGGAEVALAFPELGERLSLGQLMGARERGRAVYAKFSQLGENALFAATDDAPGRPPPAALIATAATRTATPGHEQVRARAALDGWLVARLGTDAAELAQLAGALFDDASVPVAERWLLYQTLVQLEDLAVGARADLSVEVWPELAPALGHLVEVEHRAADAKPSPGARPLAEPDLPEAARNALGRSPLPLWTAVPSGTDDDDLAAARELFRILAEPDAGAPVVGLPLASAPGDGERLEVQLRVAGMTPARRLTVDLGEGAAIALRSSAPPAVPTLAGGLPERPALEPTSEWLVARFPAPAALGRVRLSASQPPRATAVPGANAPTWVLDLIVRRVK